MGTSRLYSSWILRLPPDAEIRGDRALPEGVVIRQFEPGEERAAYQVIETPSTSGRTGRHRPTRTGRRSSCGVPGSSRGTCW
jgi:hypothetical protein